MRAFTFALALALALGAAAWLLRPLSGQPDPTLPAPPAKPSAASPASQAPRPITVEAARAELDAVLADLPDRESDPPPSTPTSDSSVSHVAGSDCENYDVIDQIVRSVARLDIDKTLDSLQMNPRCVAIGAAGRASLRASLEAYRKQDGKVVAFLGAAHVNEMGARARDGSIPIMDRALAPDIYDRVRDSCEARYLRDRANVESSELDSDREFVTLFLNTYFEALKRETVWTHRIIVSGKTNYVARMSDLPVYRDLVLGGHRELLETEVCLHLLSFFENQGALSADRRAELWAKFTKLVAAASEAKINLK